MNRIDEIAPAEPARRFWRRGAVCTVAVGATLLIVAGLAHAPDVTKLSTAPPDPGPTAPPTTSAPAEQLTADSRLDLDRIGPVRVGMTVDEASAASGLPIVVDPRTDRGRGCAHALAGGGPEGLRFMVVHGRIARIEVSGGPVATTSGIRTGTTEEAVLAAYADRVQVTANPYMGHRGWHDLVYVPDEGSAGLGLLFETDGTRVTSFRAGLTDAVMAPEGCS